MPIIFYKIFFLFISIFQSINALDIKLSLGKNLTSSGKYPLVITLNEPFIYESNPIDLFCVFDISDSMRGARLENLKATLNLIIDALEPNDRLSLIQFGTNAQTISELAFMSETQKNIDKGLVDELVAEGLTYYEYAINKFFEGINKSYSPENGRVQSVIFLTDGMGLDGKTPKKLFDKTYLNIGKFFDFTVHTFGILGNSFGLLCELSDYRDGSFYYIKDLEKLKVYVLNTIGGLRTTAFKHVDIDIESYFPILKVFESHRLNSILTTNTKRFTIHILQFVTGTEYTYVLELNIGNNIKIGDNVLEVHVKYQDFEGYNYKAYNYIKI